MMYCLTSIIGIDPHRSDKPEVPDVLCHMVSFFMAEHDIKTLQFSLDEVPDDEQ